MNLLQTQPQALAYCLPAVLGLAYCAFCLRRLRRDPAPWRDAERLAHAAEALTRDYDRHFLNIVRISSPIPERVPALEDVIGDYLDAWGR